jgi:hypothetical protein
LWLFLFVLFVFLLLSLALVVAVDRPCAKLAIIFLDLRAPKKKNPDSAVEGLPEADPLSRS